MNMALDLAMRAYGKTAPNPHVGCVIVRDGQVRWELALRARAGSSRCACCALALLQTAHSDMRSDSRVLSTLQWQPPSAR